MNYLLLLKTKNYKIPTIIVIKTVKKKRKKKKRKSHEKV